MKKVTLFKSAILALLVCVGIAACDKNSDVVPDEPETYTVNLGWAGEILDVSYEPMTRATTDDLYGIQVYSLPKSASSSTDWAPYAYGLFDDPSNITITLASGYKYRFVATMVRDGKNRIKKYNDGYTVPFSVAGGGNLNSDNKFYYDGIKEIHNINTGHAILTNGDGNVCFIPNIERFYGELTNYIPSESNNNAKIDMKRTSFGAKFIAGGKLAVDGKLEIQIDRAPKMELALTDGADEISDIFSFHDIDAAWANNNYTEDIAVNFKWIRADGTEAPLGTHTITFKRNVTTVVKVNIDKDGNDESLGIEIDESETGTMPDGDEVIITNGQME